MSFIIKIFVFLVFCLFSFLPCNCNNTNASAIKIEPRIAGGYIPEQHLLSKYVVSIRSRSEHEQNFGYTHFCAGSIIGSNRILTAAHCVSNIRPSAIKVVASTPKRLKRTQFTQEFKVIEIIIHQHYSESNTLNDIALLILEDDINFDAQFATTIALPQNEIEDGAKCILVGWGKMYMHGPLANELTYVNITVYRKKTCSRRFRNPYMLGEKLCAGDEHDHEKDACLGDSGGPLICNGFVTGIVSYGYGCASHYAGIYTNVFSFKDWIDRNGHKARNPLKILYCVCFILTTITK